MQLFAIHDSIFTRRRTREREKKMKEKQNKSINSVVSFTFVVVVEK